MKNTSPHRTNRIYLLAFLIPVTAILWRVIYRSYYYPGWDLLGAANGLFLLKNLSLIEAIKESFWLSRNFQYWNHTNSVLFSLFPGALTSLYAWDFWPHMLVFTLFVFSFWISGLALQLQSKEWAWLATAIGSSSALLSFSIVGYPYISSCLPHAMAILIIFHPRFHKNWWPALLVGLLSIEVSWHVYELGKTVFFLYFLAAFFQSKVALKNRLVYLLLGGFSLVLLFSGQKGENLNLFMSLKAYDFSFLSTRFIEILKTVFFQPGMDLPIIPVLGLFSILFLKRGRLFLAAMLLAQWGLFLLLGFKGLYELRSRRFLMVDFYSIIVLLAVIRDFSGYYAANRLVRLGAYFLALTLFAGCAWQFVSLAKFTSVPVQFRKESMPYTATKADYQIHPEYIDAAEKMTRLIREGKKLILVYNYHTYQENTTDPVALPERLYLRLGHEKFKDNILIFSNNFERYSRVPILSLTEIDKTLQQIKKDVGGLNSIDTIEEYWVLEHPDPGELNKNFVAESKLVMQSLERNFLLHKTVDKIEPFIGYRLALRTAD